MNKEQNEFAQQLCREFDDVAAKRTTWESHWEEIRVRIVPLHASFTSTGIQGEKRTQQIYDATAALALNRFAAILDSLLTPRNQTWHRLTASDPYLMKDRETRLWFEEGTRRLFKYRYAPKANFSSQNQQTYLSLGAYGTGCLFIDKLDDLKDRGLRYRNVHLGEAYFVENHQGIVDTVYRKIKLTVRQAKQLFKNNCPKKVAEDKDPNKEFEFIHCVKPRIEIDYNRVDYKGMPFAAYYIFLEDKTVVMEEGFKSFPYAVPRYMQSAGEAYGRSPAMEVLPAVKTLNEQKKTLLKQGHRAVDPIILVHDDGIADSFSMKPGTTVSGGVNADGRSLVHTLPVGNVAIGKDLMDDERALINDAFLINIFQILTESPAMTATEVMERTREKGILLAPTIGRQQSEYQGPMIERELDLLMQLGLLDPMPRALLEAKGEYTIEYDSPLSRAQRAEEASGLMRSLETTLNVVNITQNPEPLDYYNWDEIIPALNDIHGVPVKWINSMEKIQQLREGRAQQAQIQQSQQSAPGAAALMKASAVAQRGGK